MTGRTSSCQSAVTEEAHAASFSEAIFRGHDGVSTVFLTAWPPANETLGQVVILRTDIGTTTLELP